MGVWGVPPAPPGDGSVGDFPPYGPALEQVPHRLAQLRLRSPSGSRSPPSARRAGRPPPFGNIAAAFPRVRLFIPVCLSPLHVGEGLHPFRGTRHNRQTMQSPKAPQRYNGTPPPNVPPPSPNREGPLPPPGAPPARARQTAQSIPHPTPQTPSPYRRRPVSRASDGASAHHPFVLREIEGRTGAAGPTPPRRGRAGTGETSGKPEEGPGRRLPRTDPAAP